MEKYIQWFAGLMCVPLMTHGATEFEDGVPIDVVKVFLNVGMAPDVGIYSDIMEEFPPFTVPDGFEVLGSLNQGVLQRVALKTTLDREAAGAAVFNALVDRGWVEFPQPRAPQISRGFVPNGGRQPFAITTVMCHDDFGTLSLNIMGQDNYNLVSLGLSNPAAMGGTRFTCEEQLAQQQMVFNPGARAGMGGGVQQDMPSIALPEQEGQFRSNSGFFTGGGGSSSDWESRASVSIDMDLEDLFRFFADQITGQDWEPEAENVVGISATGIWKKTGDNDRELITVLTILETADNLFDLKIRTLFSGGGSGRAGIGTVNVIRSTGVLTNGTFGDAPARRPDTD